MSSPVSTKGSLPQTDGDIEELLATPERGIVYSPGSTAQISEVLSLEGPNSLHM